MVVVFQTNYADHVIPDNVLEQAKALNEEKPLTDKRTKGFKHLAAWANKQDIDFVQNISKSMRIHNG